MHSMSLSITITIYQVPRMSRNMSISEILFTTLLYFWYYDKHFFSPGGRVVYEYELRRIIEIRFNMSFSVMSKFMSNLNVVNLWRIRLVMSIGYFGRLK